MARLELQGFLTMTEVSERKGTTRQTIWRAVKAGVLDYVTVGGRTLIADNEKLAQWQPHAKRQEAAQARWQSAKKRSRK